MGNLFFEQYNWFLILRSITLHLNMDKEVPRTKRMRPIQMRSAKKRKKKRENIRNWEENNNCKQEIIAQDVDEPWTTWKRMKWIMESNSSGFLNQKSSSRGLNLASEKKPAIPAFSSANVAITCCSFVPTKRTSCSSTLTHKK